MTTHKTVEEIMFAIHNQIELKNSDYDFVKYIVTKAIQDHEDQVRREVENKALETAVDGYNQEKNALITVLQQTGNQEFYKRSDISKRLRRVDENIKNLLTNNND